MCGPVRSREWASKSFTEGADLCVEVKCWSDLVEQSASPCPGTIYRGGTHAFGNTEERAIHTVLGVSERTDDDARAWDHSTGKGAVKRNKGHYHDAVHVKRNTVTLFLVSLFGGLAPGAVDHIRALSRRSIDNTEYELDIYCDHIPERAKRHRTNDSYVQYWARRMSSTAVMADARRCLRRLPALELDAREAMLGRARRGAPE